MKKTKLLLITLISAGLTFSQSPWTQNKGEGFSQLSFTFIPENNLLFQKDGVAIETERYVSDNTIQSYNEIGIAKDWVIPPASPSVTLVVRTASSRLVLP